MAESAQSAKLSQLQEEIEQCASQHQEVHAPCAPASTRAPPSQILYVCVRFICRPTDDEAGSGRAAGATRRDPAG